MAESDSAQRIPGYCALCTSSCGCISVVEAGRLAYEAGRMPRRLYASASSPLDQIASY